VLASRDSFIDKTAVKQKNFEKFVSFPKVPFLVFYGCRFGRIKPFILLPVLLFCIILYIAGLSLFLSLYIDKEFSAFCAFCNNCPVLQLHFIAFCIVGNSVNNFKMVFAVINIVYHNFCARAFCNEGYSFKQFGIIFFLPNSAAVMPLTFTTVICSFADASSYTFDA